MKHSILLVDDEPVARVALARTLKGLGYVVYAAEDAETALAELASRPVDVVMADLGMPGMDGLELLGVVGIRYPAVKRVLVTAHNIDEYLARIRDCDVGDVLPKGAGLRPSEIRIYLEALLSGDVFGLERYFDGAPVRSAAIRSYGDARRACAAIVEGRHVRNPLYLEMMVDELISNAVFHAGMGDVPRSQWNEGFVIEDDRAITVSWACDAEKVGVGVADPGGTLQKATIFDWLQRPVSPAQEGEEHGRGLLLVRRLADRFVINILPGRRTECIVLQYHESVHRGGQKPLLVHEVKK